MMDMKVDYCEYCCVEINCCDGKLLFTSIYRSPNSGVANNANLLQLMQEIGDMKVQYKVLVGDFNLPHINWNNWTTRVGLAEFDTVFIEKVRDCFFNQHIKEVTRMRGESTGNTLDLLFSNDESIIEDIKLESPLGRSDHACVHFQCQLQELEARSKRKVEIYEKADYQLMKTRLNIDWTHYLSPDLDAERKWVKFSNKMREVIEDCVPMKMSSRKRKRTNEHLPMNKKLWTKVKRKQRLWEKLKKMKEENWPPREYSNVEKDYRRLNNQIRRETRNAVKTKEREIAGLVKENPKVFWKYVTSKTRTKSRIGDLYKDENRDQVSTTDKEKADILSEQLAGVFVNEPDGEPPQAIRKDVPRLDHMVITNNKMRKLIKK